MRFCIIPIRVAQVKKSDNTKYWEGCEKTRTPYTTRKGNNQYSHFGEQLKLSSEVENMHTL